MNDEGISFLMGALLSGCLSAAIVGSVVADNAHDRAIAAQSGHYTLDPVTSKVGFIYECKAGKQ